MENQPLRHVFGGGFIQIFLGILEENDPLWTEMDGENSPSRHLVLFQECFCYAGY